MTEIRKLTCHCGSVELEVTLAEGLRNIRRCDCSLCSRKGYVMASVLLKDIRISKGENILSLYQWGTKVAKHYFCSQCGVYTHHKRRSNPKEFALNIACIEGVSPFVFGNIPIGNGDLNAPLPGIDS